MAVKKSFMFISLDAWDVLAIQRLHLDIRDKWIPSFIFYLFQFSISDS